MSEPAWLQLARKELGVAEIVGSKHNPVVLAYFRDAKHSEIKDDETSWCAAFVGAMLERSGIVSTRSLLARSYLEWGVKVTTPKPGDIVVFKRGTSSWQGHVAFYLYEKDGKIFHLGGNQSNKVSITSTTKSKLLGYRRPKAVTEQAVEKMDEVLVKALDILQPSKGVISLSEFALFTGQKLTDENRTLIRGSRDAMTPETLRKIIAKNYWAPISAPQLPFEHAVFALDTALEHGAHKTRLAMQRASGVAADGIIGPKSTSAIKKTAAPAFIDALIREREALLKSSDDWDLKAADWKRAKLALKAKLIPPPPAAPTVRYVTEGAPTPAAVAPAAVAPTPTITEKKMTETTVPAPKPEYKPWSQSLTIWGTIVTFASTVLPALAQLLGWDITAGDVQNVGSGVTTAIQAIGGVIGTVMAIIGRTKATVPVKFLG
jgi:uncharacterized protein (TIGR02594 family)